MSIRSKVSAHIVGSGLFWPLIGLIVFTSLFYVYSVQRTVVLVAERNNIEAKIVDNRSDIARLEAEYIGVTGDVTIELAHSLGYSETSNVVYIPQKSVSVLTRTDTIQ